MPRNPYKKHCEISGCRNWAMRDNVHCRSHLDHVLGPRGAGAPRGNSNGWRNYQHVPPATVKRIRRIAYDLYQHPENLQGAIADLLDDFYHRGSSEEIPRTLKAIAALKIVLEVLVDAHADILFVAEMQEILALLPPDRQAAVQHRLWQVALEHNPLNRVAYIRKARPDFMARVAPNPQLPVQPSTSEDSR